MAVPIDNGTCKAIHGTQSNRASNIKYYIGYQCDGGNVGGPDDASAR